MSAIDAVDGSATGTWRPGKPRLRPAYVGNTEILDSAAIGSSIEKRGGHPYISLYMQRFRTRRVPER